MKKINFLLLTVLFIPGCIPGEETIDIEKEKEAIKAVIEAESNAYYSRDMEQQFSCFLQDETTTIVVSGEEGLYDGWGKISEAYQGFYEDSPEASNLKVENKNYKIKVYRDCAWAVYDEYYVYANDSVRTGPREIRFLEKVDDEWKIVLLSLLSRENTGGEDTEEEAEP